MSGLQYLMYFLIICIDINHDFSASELRVKAVEALWIVTQDETLVGV